MKIIFATNNEHKLREVQQILGSRYELLPLSQIGCDEDVPETADTIEGNALQKARYVFERYGEKYHLPVFADDTGLEVEALDGAPGVHTARYAGDAHDTEANVDLLLRNMAGKANRRACFRTVIALIGADGSERTMDGRVDGEITGERMGEGGFGYDPVFRPDGYAGTFAQLGEEVKNSISHRARAVQKLVDCLGAAEQHPDSFVAAGKVVATALMIAINFLFGNMVNAQEIGKWSLYPAYGNAEKVVPVGKTLWAVNCGNLWSYDTETEEINTFDRSNGLSDVCIKHIAYSPQTKNIVVIYENANIDIIDVETTQVFNIANIKNSDVTKVDVNDLCINGTEAWVSTAFGVVRIDLEEHIVVDTYKYDGGVRSACISDSTPNPLGEYVPAEPTLYMATADGVFYAPLSANLHDLSRYGKLISGKVKNLHWWNGCLIATDLAGSFLRVYTKGGLTYFGQTKVSFIGEYGENMVFMNNKTVFVLNPDLKVSTLFNHDNLLSCANIGDDLYVSAGYNKVLRYTQVDGQWVVPSEGVSPNGPRLEDFYRLRYAGDRLLMVSGGADYKALTFYPSSLSYFDDGICYNMDTCVMNASRSYHDMLDFIEDPFDPDHHFACAYGGGLFEYRGTKQVNRYTADNSILGKASSKADKYTRLGALAYDHEGTLWITNPNVVNSIVYRTKDDEWGHMYNSTFTSMQMINILEIYGDYMWVASGMSADLPKIGIMGVKMNGTPTVFTDDRVQCRMNPFIQQDGLRYDVQHIFCMAVDMENQVWVGTDMGLFVIPNPDDFFNNDFTFYQIKINRNDGSGLADYLLNGLWIRAIGVDAADRKWIGTAGQGVYLISPDGQEEIFHFTTENSPLPSDNVTSLAVSKTSGEVAIGTDKGLVTFMSDAQQASDKLDADNIICYPNPVPPNYHGNVNIKGLTMNAEVKITTVTGQVIYRTRSNGGTATWNCRDARGRRVATGVYNVIASEADGSEAAITRIVVTN